MKKVSYLTKENIDDLIYELYNPVSLFLCSPNSIYPLSALAFSKMLVECSNYMIEQDKKIISFLSVNKNNVIQFLITKKIYQGKSKAKELLLKVKKLNSELYCYVHSQKREQQALMISSGFSKTDKTKHFSFEGKNELFFLYSSKRD